MADMLAACDDHMVFACEVLEQQAKADERDMRCLTDIVEKHNTDQQGDEG